MASRVKGVILLMILTMICTMTCACEESQELECGELLQTEYADVIIDNPVKTLTLKSGDGGFDAYVKVPIRISAHDKVTIDAKDFNSQVLDKKKCFPESLTLKDGDSYEGFLFVEWPSADIEEGAAPISEIVGEKYSYSCSWSFNYDTETKKCKSVKGVRKVLPNTPIKVKGTIIQGSYNYEEDEYIALFKCANTGKLYFSVPYDEWPEFDEHSKDAGDGRKVTIEGTVRNVITTDSDGKKYKRPFLDDVKITKVHKHKKNKKKKKKKEQSREMPTRSIVNSDEMVYVTPTGRKYHKYWCRYANGSGVREIPLSKAKAKGLAPCALCH